MQLCLPTWHGLVGVQDTPWVQATHEPPSQTLLVPHEVPLARWLPVSMQSDVPVEQLVVPTSHALSGVHATPSVHETHEPSSQISLVPHEVPLAAWLPVGMHTETPDEQVVAPRSQELLGTHDRPATQGPPPEDDPPEPDPLSALAFASDRLPSFSAPSAPASSSAGGTGPRPARDVHAATGEIIASTNTDPNHPVTPLDLIPIGPDRCKSTTPAASEPDASSNVGPSNSVRPFR